jgi:hypothetical protein
MAKNTHVGKKILSANEVRQHAPRGWPWVFFFWGRVGMLAFFCWSQGVPMKSQWAPNSSSLYPISLAISFSLLIYITSPKMRLKLLGLIKAFLFFGGDGQTNMPITKAKI